MGAGLIVAGAGSGVGKTLITLGMLRALRRTGLSVAAAKCGPDYIDPAFHAAAGGGMCVNLDPWAMPPARIRALARDRQDRAGPGGLVVCEGAMGLFDGVLSRTFRSDAAPRVTGRTADLARLTGWPVLLVLDAAGTSASLAAVARGFATQETGVTVAGVILNRVASARHTALIRAGFAQACPGTPPILGEVARAAPLVLPERHLGLVQADERDDLDGFLERAADLIGPALDLQRLRALSQPLADGPCVRTAGALPPPGRRIAVARDAAFGFVYPWLLDEWGVRTGDLFSPLADETPTDGADAIYLPGGYPELHAHTLAAARRFKRGMRAAAARGVAIWGECGGYMTLGDALIDAAGHRHEMLGLLALTTGFSGGGSRHLGYRRLTLRTDTALGRAGAVRRAHEFRYAAILSEGGDGSAPLCDVHAADGTPLGPAGLVRGSVAGSFMHLLAAETGPPRPSMARGSR